MRKCNEQWKQGDKERLLCKTHRDANLKRQNKHEQQKETSSSCWRSKAVQCNQNMVNTMAPNETTARCLTGRIFKKF